MTEVPKVRRWGRAEGERKAFERLCQAAGGQERHSAGQLSEIEKRLGS